MSRHDAIVVGAGANGLAAAALLAKRGRRVLVLEERDVIGGTNSTEEAHPGFRVNACRDDAGWIPAALIRELDLTRRGLRIMPAGAGLVAVSPDAPALAAFPDVARTMAGLQDAASPRDASRWPGFCALVARTAGLLERLSARRPPRVQPRVLGDLLDLAGVGRLLRGLGKREMMEVLRVLPMPVADLAEEWFESTPLRAALAVQGVAGVMHGPMSGGTALVFVHQQVGRAEGAVGVRTVVRGGAGALVEALAIAARELGVEIRLGAAVGAVQVREGKATGVVLATGEEVGGRHVLSSAGPRRSFAWVDPSWLDPAFLQAVDHVRHRGATARVHYALDALPRVVSGGREVSRDAMGGTMVLAASIGAVELAYDEAKYGALPSAPALTLSIPTLVDPVLAPERRHVLSVTAHHVPHALRGGWTADASAQLAERVTDLVAQVVPDLRERTLHRSVLTPADLAARYGCDEGSLWQGELALDQFLFMRPVPACARYATPLPGFWLCGTGSHPAVAGGAAGMLAAREVLAAR